MTFSKKTVALIGVLILVVGVASYFLFLSPKSTEIKFAVANPSLASNVRQAVSGSIKPAEAGRVIVVEVRTPGGAWGEAARVATDAVGAFKATFPMTILGESSVRVSVDAKGRRSEATAKPVTVAVLNPTQLEAQVPKFGRADRALRIPGRVTPAGERTIKVESSTDGQNYTAVGQTSSNATTGQFVVSVAGLKPGTVRVRVSVDSSPTDAAVQGSPTVVKVEDYVAAGKQYLAIVKKTNDLYDAYDKLVGTYEISKAKEAAARLSAALTLQAQRFRGYAFWPQEVRANIALIAKADILEADHWNRLAHAKSLADFNAIGYPGELVKGSNNAPALVRAALGLPKRE